MIQVRHRSHATYSRQPRQPWRVIVKDDTGTAELVFFRFTRETQMPQGAKLLVSGKLDSFNGRLTIAHPEHVVPIDQADRIPAIEPVWPLTAGLWPRQIAAGLAQALDLLPDLPEWHDPALLKREKWPPFNDALRTVQAPTGKAPERRFRNRLAYDELLAGQVAHALIRGRVRARTGQPLIGDSHLRDVALQRFGFAPTASQVRHCARSTPISPRPAECCGCCKATSAPARPWSRCWPCCARWRPASRPP